MSCNAHALAASRRMLVAQDVDLIQETLRQVAKGTRVKNLTVVDIGAGSGTTALSALEAGPPVTVYSYDDNVDAINWGEEAVKNIGRSSDWHKLLAWEQLEAALGNKQIRFAMIDHEHTEDAVDEALFWVRERLAKDGRVWVHDYADPADYGLPSERTPGVALAVNSAVKEGFYEITEYGGLGVVLARVD